MRGMAAVERQVYGADIGALNPGDLSALKLHTPFFRFTGFAETPDLHAFFAANNVGIFGTDLWAADWVPITPKKELGVVLNALDHAGRGMLLLHDSKPWTAAMLPDRFMTWVLTTFLRSVSHRRISTEIGQDLGAAMATHLVDCR